MGTLRSRSAASLIQGGNLAVVETIVLYVLGIVVIVVGLAVSIGLHEIGHLVPAKAFGVKVSQYMIGFGPTVFSRTKGETEYGFKAIPMGGYISMSGMFPPGKAGASRISNTSIFQALVQDARQASADTIDEGEEKRAFYNLPVLKRIVIMLGGPTMNLIIAIVLFGVILSGIGSQQYSTTIGSVSACILPSSATSTTCSSGAAASPALTAGLKTGDELVSIDGRAVASWADETTVIRESAGKALTFVIDRDGVRRTLIVTPATTKGYAVKNGQYVLDSAGKKVVTRVGFVGVTPTIVRVHAPLTAVLPAVGTNIASTAELIVNLPERLYGVAQAAFGGGARNANGPISVLGVARISGQEAAVTTTPIIDRLSVLISLVASLNIALFVFNMIPLLPLDGGHIAGAIVEGIRRTFAKIFKRQDPGHVDTAKLIPLTFGVVILLGAMSVLLVYADIVNPVKIG